MTRTSITLKKKLEIIDHFQSTNNKKQTAAHFSTTQQTIYPSQIRKWVSMEQTLRDAAKKKNTKKTIHLGVAPPHEILENQIFVWILHARREGIAISTKMIIAKAITIDPSFKDKGEENQQRWAYRFINRYNLSIRRPTHVGQKKPANLLSQSTNFVSAFNNQFQGDGMYKNISPMLVFNMDETGIYFEAIPRTTVDIRGSNTISVRSAKGSNPRVTVCLTVSSTGAKLPLFMIFKAKAGATVEKSLPDILPQGVVGICQEKAWMDERGMDIWVRKVWYPYVSNFNATVLLLDDFECHKQERTIEKMNSVGTSVDIIDGGLTSKVQPIDVGIVKPFKNKISEQYMEYMSAQLGSSSGSSSIIAPDRKLIGQWAKVAWDAVDTYTIYRTFRHIGYCI